MPGETSQRPESNNVTAFICIAGTPWEPGTVRYQYFDWSPNVHYGSWWVVEVVEVSVQLGSRKETISPKFWNKFSADVIMRALLLHPSLAWRGAEQGYLKWLHHDGVECLVFYLIFSPDISWWSAGQPGLQGGTSSSLVFSGRAGRGRLYRCVSTLPIVSLSVEVNSAQTTADMRHTVTQWTVRQQRTECLAKYQSTFSSQSHL